MLTQNLPFCYSEKFYPIHTKFLVKIEGGCELSANFTPNLIILNLSSGDAMISAKLGPEYVKNIFSRSLKKTCHQRKLFAFQFLNDKIYSYIYQKRPFGTWQFGKIGVLVNFIIQKLKSKHLVCLSFL